jgi:hypothetical protein
MGRLHEEIERPRDAPCGAPRNRQYTDQQERLVVGLAPQ